MNAFDRIHAEPVTNAAGLRHFLDLDRLEPADLRRIVDEARRRKEARSGLPKGATDAAAGLDAPLAERMLLMVFEKPSTRTRVSFEMAMRQLGGQASALNAADLQLGRGETIADTARVLSSYADAIMLRTYAPEALDEMAAHSTAPVINGLTNRSHPCQILTDILTIEESLGPIAGRVVAWTGDGNNVAATYIQAAAAFGFEIRVACPETLEPDPEMTAAARAAGATLVITRDADAAVAGADVVVTDTWLSMNDKDAARIARHNQLAPYQVDARRMALAKPGAIFLHCMPAHRGEEATAEVMDGPQSRMFEAAENRLHLQKAILLWCLDAL